MNVESIERRGEYVHVRIIGVERTFVYPVNKFSSKDALLKEIASSMQLDEKRTTRKSTKFTKLKNAVEDVKDNGRN